MYLSIIIILQSIKNTIFYMYQLKNNIYFRIFFQFLSIFRCIIVVNFDANKEKYQLIAIVISVIVSK